MNTVATSRTEHWWPSRYGHDHEIGSLNEVIAQVTLRGVATVRVGTTFDLSRVLDESIPAFPGVVPAVLTALAPGQCTSRGRGTQWRLEVPMMSTRLSSRRRPRRRWALIRTGSTICGSGTGSATASDSRRLSRSARPASWCSQQVRSTRHAPLGRRRRAESRWTRRQPRAGGAQPDAP